jgi:hypothetical protein
MYRNGSYLISFGLTVVALLMLAGCQPVAGEPVAAAPAEMESAAEEWVVTAMDPADRKFFNRGYATHYPSLKADNDPWAGIDPADRKFYDAGYVAHSRAWATGPSWPANIDPADRKFYINGHITNNPER